MLILIKTGMTLLIETPPPPKKTRVKIQNQDYIVVYKHNRN